MQSLFRLCSSIFLCFFFLLYLYLFLLFFEKIENCIKYTQTTQPMGKKSIPSLKHVSHQPSENLNVRWNTSLPNNIRINLIVNRLKEKYPNKHYHKTGLTIMFLQHDLDAWRPCLYKTMNLNILGTLSLQFQRNCKPENMNQRKQKVVKR